MGRPKGGKNKYWTKEEKLKIVNKHIIDGISINQLGKDLSISKSMIAKCVGKFVNGCEQALENKHKAGNPLVKYQKKELTEFEALEFENMKLRIDNERLKKGYIVKGDGSVVIFKL